MATSIRAAGLKDVGQQRAMNEDEFAIEWRQSSGQEPTGLFIVADGMGGTEGGELASKWAIETIRDELRDLFTPPDPRKTVRLDESELEALANGQTAPTRKLGDASLERMIKQAVLRANAVVMSIARAKPEEARDTGTTVTLAIIKGGTAYVANVGDSRTYLQQKGELTPLTTDHSLVARLVATGQIRPEDVYTHPQRNLIYRSLGDKADVDVDIFRQALQPGDRLLLCSDGLWEMMRGPEIAEIMQNASSPETACQQLIDAANAGGGEDNIAAVVVWID